jgi:uncharacterized membrane protein
MSLYLAFSVCCLYLFLADDPFVKKILLGLSATIAFGSLWFIYIQNFLLHAFCPYCMSAHTCGLLIAVLTFFWLRGDKDTSGRTLLGITCVSLAVVVVFAVFQLLTTPSYRTQTGRVQDPLPVPDVSTSPVVGPKDAAHVVALLYDYQCPHCKVIHGLLEEVAERMEGKVAFVLCPSPLSPACNPYIPAGQDRFPGSCTMAKLALGLWENSPADFAVFDRWLWEEPRAEDECFDMAMKICPDVSSESEWVTFYMARSLELFARTSMSGKGGIPRFVYGDSWAVPEVDNADDLVKVVEALLSDSH